MFDPSGTTNKNINQKTLHILAYLHKWKSNEGIIRVSQVKMSKMLPFEEQRMEMMSEVASFHHQK